MKSFNKWMVVPYEEKVEAQDDVQLDAMKKILTKNSIKDTQKYDDYNNIFKNYINKKSSTITNDSGAKSSIDKINEDISEKLAIGEAKLNNVDEDNKSKINSLKNFFQKRTDTYQAELDGLHQLLMEIVQNKSAINLSPYRSLAKNTKSQKSKRILDAAALASSQKIIEPKKLKNVKQKKLELEIEKKKVEEKNPMKKNVEVVDPIQWQHADQSMIEID